MKQGLPSPSPALLKRGWSEIETGWWVHRDLHCAICFEGRKWAAYTKNNDSPRTARRFSRPSDACRYAEEQATEEETK